MTYMVQNKKGIIKCICDHAKRWSFKNFYQQEFWSL